MKPNFFYHPLIKALCLLLCVLAAVTCVYSTLRVAYMDTNGAMENPVQFRLQTATYSPTNALYWPKHYAWEYFETAYDQGYYTYADTLSDIVQEYIFTGALSPLFEQSTAIDLPPSVLSHSMTETELGVHPKEMTNRMRSFLETHANDHFRFRITLDHPEDFGSTTLFANVSEDDDLTTMLDALAREEYQARLGDTEYTLTLTCGLLYPFRSIDAYSVYYRQWASDASSWEMWMLAIGASALLTLAFLVCLLFQSGMRYRTPGLVYLSRTDRLPFEITAGVKFMLGFAFAALTFACVDSVYDSSRFFGLLFGYETGDLRAWLLPLAALLCTVFLCLVVLSFLCECVRRFRGGKWWHNTLLYRILRFVLRVLRFCIRMIGSVFSHLPLLWRWLVGCALFGLWTLLVIGTGRGLVVLWFLTALVLGFGGCVWLLWLDRAVRGAKRIADGEIDHHIDTQSMFGAPKTLSLTLNQIGDATQKAVAERMKSERFRSELITNVSHDLKTPLTSIINYTDLLSKEPCENETMRTYIEVLCRQSNRLKKLTDDLLDASKASSGALAVTLAPTDAAELLTQAAGEYEERFQNSNLTPVIDIKEQPLMITADGRHLWRVFDNLLSNICKYSMPGTRVYLTAARESGDVVLTFRNISGEPIHVSAEELTERFVRGDASRHTEGSGLGLAIAESLTALQGGTLSLTVDGDLFKATVRFAQTHL